MVSEAVPSPSTEATPAATAPSPETSPRAEASPAPAAPAAQPVGASGGSPSVPDIDSLLQHPVFRDRFDRLVQARSDQIFQRQMDRWRKEQETDKAKDQHISTLKARIGKDRYELGGEVQEEAARELLKAEIRPLVEAELRPTLEAELRERFHGEGQETILRWIGSKLEKYPEWKKANFEERMTWLRQYESPIEIFEELKEKQAQKHFEAKLAEIRAAAEREARAEERQNEPGPEIGGGAPPQSEKEFLAAFAAGRLSTREDFARARRITGMT